MFGRWRAFLFIVSVLGAFYFCFELPAEFVFVFCLVLKLVCSNAFIALCALSLCFGYVYGNKAFRIMLSFSFVFFRFSIVVAVASVAVALAVFM